MTQASIPQLTIAIIELVGGAAFARALEQANALAMSEPRFTVIAIRKQTLDGPDNTTSSTAKKPPAADTIPLRRARALAQCSTTFIAFVEDTIEFGEQWIEAAYASFQADNIAASWGPIDISPNLPARYRALGLLEYGRHQRCQPSNQNEQASIPGACMVYRTDDISRLDCVRANGIIEHELVEQFLKRNLRIRCVPEMATRYFERDAYGGRLMTRFLHGRLYASTRLSRLGLAQRATHAMKTFLLPFVFSVRAIRARQSGVAGSHPMLEFYWVFLLSTAWATGEMVGAVKGPGNSAAGWT